MGGRAEFQVPRTKREFFVAFAMRCEVVLAASVLLDRISPGRAIQGFQVTCVHDDRYESAQEGVLELLGKPPFELAPPPWDQETPDSIRELVRRARVRIEELLALQRKNAWWSRAGESCHGGSASSTLVSCWRCAFLRFSAADFPRRLLSRLYLRSSRSFFRRSESCRAASAMRHGPAEASRVSFRLTDGGGSTGLTSGSTIEEEPSG
jgi:hypothetical protein